MIRDPGSSAASRSPGQSGGQQQTGAHRRSRGSILDRLRSHHVPAPPLPTLDHQRLVRFEDPLATFQSTLASVGGESHVIQSPDEILHRLQQIKTFAEAKRVASTIPEAVPPTIDLEQIDDPHTLATLDWTVVRGEFGVAENGSIWIDGRTLPHRVMLFIAQYLAIVISRRQLVDHMHDAYRRVGRPPASFGIFVSGPSKTADIEQSLVIGAHGCRKLQVFLLP